MPVAIGTIGSTSTAIPASTKDFATTVALPGKVGVALHMLERAAAAGAEVPADRRDAERARLLDTEEPAAVAAPLDHDGLARAA